MRRLNLVLNVEKKTSKAKWKGGMIRE